MAGCVYVIIFSAFSNIYSGGLFLLTNKNLESAGTCGFQTKFRQIALFDAIVDIFRDFNALSWKNVSLIHGERSFSQSACGGHYVFLREDIVWWREGGHHMHHILASRASFVRKYLCFSSGLISMKKFGVM